MKLQSIAIIMAFAINSHTPSSHAALASWHDQTNFANSPSEVFGWACDSENFSAALHVEIYDGNNKVGTVRADVMGGPGVADRCGGNAQHVFTWPYPESMRDGKSHQITVYALMLSGQKLQLAGSPRTVVIPSDAKPNGWFDFVTPDYAWGWACDPTYTNADSAGIQVDLYAEDGTFLGSITPNIYSEKPVADRCGGAHNRSFQFALPSSFQTNAKRAVYAFTENRDGSGRSLIGGGPKTVMFRSQLEEAYGTQPFVSSTMVDTIIQSNLEPENGNGAFRSATHCYGIGADDQAVSWEPYSFTGFSTGSLNSARLSWQRGSANMFGEMVVQAKGSTIGIFTIAGGTGWDSNCGNVAGNVTGFTWDPVQTPSPPRPWPTGSQSNLAKELIVRFSGKFKSAEGAAFVHPVFFFGTQQTTCEFG